MTEVVDAKDYLLNMDVKYNFLHQYACNPDNFWPVVREQINTMPATFQRWQDNGALVWVDSVSFVSDMPGKNADEDLGGGGASTDALIDLIKNAKRSVNIQSPYLITTEVS